MAAHCCLYYCTCCLLLLLRLRLRLRLRLLQHIVLRDFARGIYSYLLAPRSHKFSTKNTKGISGFPRQDKKGSCPIYSRTFEGFHSCHKACCPSGTPIKATFLVAPELLTPLTSCHTTDAKYTYTYTWQEVPIKVSPPLPLVTQSFNTTGPFSGACGKPN